MDCKKIHNGGGHSQLEFCDLFSSGRDLIHVKRYGRSSAPLSHLFAQGLDDAEGLRVPVIDAIRRLTTYALDSEDRFSVLLSGTEQLLTKLLRPLGQP